jgi:hypothetical protein
MSNLSFAIRDDQLYMGRASLQSLPSFLSLSKPMQRLGTLFRYLSASQSHVQKHPFYALYISLMAGSRAAIRSRNPMSLNRSMFGQWVDTGVQLA